MRYELFYLIGISKEAQLDSIKAEIKALVESQGGVFEEKETQEKRKLAYEINHENQGIYITQRFSLEEPEKLAEINVKLNLSRNILRFIISRASELPELKTKEERISEALSQQAAQEKSQAKETAKKAEQTAKSEIKSSAPQKTIAPQEPEVKKEAAPATEEEKEATKKEEDIDKKLEEILNI